MGGADEADDSEAVDGEWNATKWLVAIGIAKVVTRALNIPPRSQCSAFDYVKKLKPHEVEGLLMDANLGGLTDVLVRGIEQLKTQRVGSAAVLNDKFSSSAKFQMSYGSLSLFYGGLESLLGPPQMHKDPKMKTPLQR